MAQYEPHKPQPSPEELKRFERKVYLVCLAALIAGAAMLASVWTVQSVFASIVGTIGIIIIIIALIMLGFFADLFFKARGVLKAEEENQQFKETYINWPKWYTKWGRNLLIFIACGTGYVFAQMHENDFGGNKFVWHSIIAGTVAGLILYNLVKLQKPAWNNNPNMSAEIGFYFVLAAVYLCVVFGPVINKYFAESPAVCNEYPALKASTSRFIDVKVNGRKERFDPPASFRKLLVNKPTVVLCVRKGYLGYEYVERFELTAR